MHPRPTRDQLHRVAARLMTHAERCDAAAAALRECGMATPAIAEVTGAVAAESAAIRAVVAQVLMPALGETSLRQDGT